MQRRSLLQAMTTMAAGASLTTIDAEASSSVSRGNVRKSARRDQFIARDGTTLFYRDWGRGRPVVFVHAWALNADIWQYVTLPLAEAGVRCIAYDRRGHGRSEAARSGYEYDTLADDLAALIAHLGLRDVTLVGHSMGGGEVVRYLSRHGQDRVSGIVLAAGTLPLLLKTPDNPLGFDKAFFDSLRAAWTRDLPKWASDFGFTFWGPGTSLASAQMQEWAIRMITQPSLRAMLRCSFTFSETDFRAELPQIRIPTLFIHGDQDVTVPIHFGQMAAALVPGSELKVYEGAPHGIIVAHAERVAADISAFVS